MISVALIVFREFLEIVIILGLIYSATYKMPGSRSAMLKGIGVGTIGSILAAYFINAITYSFSGNGKELLDVSILLISSILIGWTAIWVKEYSKKIHKKIQDISNTKNYNLLIILTSCTLLREGLEIVLLVHGVIIHHTYNIYSIITALCLGTISGIAIGIAFYMGLLSFAKKHIFSITSTLLILIAAGMAADAAHILETIDILPSFAPLWDSSWLLSENSTTGQLASNIFGYCSQPDIMQVMFFVATICVIFYGIKKAKLYKTIN